jgi:GDP-L-fucose synthase
MKLFVTGSAGFIGGKLVKHFESQGHVVVHPVRQQLDLTNHKAVDEFFDKENIDVVVHCAVAGRTNMSTQDIAITGETLVMFRNLYANRHKFKRLVNIASGYEFDHTRSINLAKEDDINNVIAMPSYGMGKNLVSRCVQATDNFFNLRLFGMFHEDESAVRFFKKLQTGTGPFTIDEDRQFDFVYLEDTLPMFDSAVNGKIKHKDINLVYEQKYWMSELVKMFCEVNNIDREVVVNKQGSNHYTGDYTRWAAYSHDMVDNIEVAFKRYTKNN